MEKDGDIYYIRYKTLLLVSSKIVELRGNLIERAKAMESENSGLIPGSYT